MQYIWGLLGILGIFVIAVAFSKNRKAINPRTVIGAFAIQFIFALIVLKWELGKKMLNYLAAAVQSIIDSTNAGIQFLFGGILGAEKAGFTFALQVLPIIIFFCSLIAVLYYLGIMQWATKIIGGFLAKVLKTSETESMSAAANIFLGPTEAPLVVKPYIEKMTKSELFAVMVGGLACVSGSVLGGYAMLGVPIEYLLAAAFMGAPGGLLLAKIIMPETDHQLRVERVSMVKDTESRNVIDAAARGASDGLKIAAGVGAMLLAFISLIFLVNMIIGWIGGVFGIEALTLEQILGYLFAPIAFLIGVPWSEALQAGSFIGQKFVLNEFVAYTSFAPEIAHLSPKSVVVISFALCGFANLASIALLIGGLGGIAPSRRQDLAEMGFRAVIAATLANLMSAAIAGMLV
ncbi:NupC/NupG family nucleoside CNT transporter [Paenibacillus melissococcoides]|uniref:Nucleoside permease n=1 Tax=Paenibacillus melissococcoides TaxID=2912268 RepID=A0ABN8UAR0_9BACL|nr:MULTISPECIES: NupC/NupG family nucleoside CNT transporter [Paenibacillus]MEB9892439.1 NupC/NupG family nucleoside CNT transporter [Bacillus cereus]CAH8248238.1 NupC/NupG family nucleoside CNT transporter [Paenibacillus melissococcoides]CAH8718080.1 NupC/NupG family nucleoside CNT transporter [Paenibacillus melissococcoides]CAH8719042.1 NupC/NupG family nucleoside CNT transporter [Paenibacillus melissococcoides]GIO78680.1 nucleoside permease [Paenibacillus dendritiformis]